MLMVLKKKIFFNSLGECSLQREFPLSKDALSQVVLIWSKGTENEVENVTNRQTADGQMDAGQKVIRKAAFSSSELINI